MRYTSPLINGLAKRGEEVQIVTVNGCGNPDCRDPNCPKNKKAQSPKAKNDDQSERGLFDVPAGSDKLKWNEQA